MGSKNFAASRVVWCFLVLMLSNALLSQDAVTLTRQGLEMTNQGRYREAEEFLRHAVEIAGPTNATAVYNLASLYQRQGRFKEAERLHRLALQHIEQMHGPFDPAVAQSLNDLGALYRLVGRYSEAIGVLERAVQVLDRNAPQRFASAVHNNLGNAYLDVREYAKADTAVRRALAIAESGHYEDRSDLAYIMSSLGRGYVLRKQYLEAEATYGTAVSMCAATLGSQHPEYALALTNLALVYQRQGRFREALPLLESAKDILERSFGREAPILATTLYACADVMKGLGRKSEARQFARRAKSIVRPDAGTVDIRVLRQHWKRKEVSAHGSFVNTGLHAVK